MSVNETTQSTSGGPSYGWIVSVIDRPDMTHDRYFLELQAHLDALKAGRADG